MPLDMCFDDFVRANFLNESVDATNDKTEEDYADDRVGEDDSATNVGSGIEVTEADSQDGHVREVKLLGQYSRMSVARSWGKYRVELPGLLPVLGLDKSEDTAACCKPDKEEHGLQNQLTLGIGQLERIGVLPKKIPEHVDHEDHRTNQI